MQTLRLPCPLEKHVRSLYGGNSDDLLSCPLAQIEDTGARGYALRLSCTPLLNDVHDQTGHFNKLDRDLSLLLPRRHSTIDGLPVAQEAPIQKLCSKVKSLLSRLPEVPQRSFYLPLNSRFARKGGSTLWDGIKGGSWAAKYILPEARSQLQQQPGEDSTAMLDLMNRMRDLAWDNLYVTRYIDTNSLTLATVLARQGNKPDLGLAQRSLNYVNLLSELFDEFETMSNAVSMGIEAPFEDMSDQGRALKDALFTQEHDDHVQAMAIIKVFLWSAWQRSLMLHFYYVIGVQLVHGYSSTWNSLLAVRGVFELNSLSRGDSRENCTEYMCNWAFGLLKTSRTSVGLDFRRMISRFDAQFHDRSARCIRGSEDACAGGRPETCQRFTAAETAAQSAHVLSCSKDCAKIVWDASSYHGSLKPAAIVATEESRHLEYLPVSSETLAISHVWSHGQGGRPESGINACLHQRYCRLANKFGCDTYWIDVAAIPSETKLRRQAINSISHIFAIAKVTVVIDMDVQTVDVDPSVPTIDQIEMLVSTLLVSDWTVRGWTLLEGIRASRAIFLLCRHDRVVNLRQALLTLHERGSVDIAALLGSTQHLIPHADPSTTKSVEEAGYLLSQRHTSWPEDVIICWSLLINRPVQTKAADLWRQQVRVRSAFLLSSAPRVSGVNGLGWAPDSPYIRPIHRAVDLPCGRKQEYTVRFPCYDGGGSLFAQITDRGLRGRWRIIRVDSSFLENVQEMCCHLTHYEDEEVTFDESELVYAYPDEALACHTMEALLSRAAEVRLVRALDEDGMSPYVGSSQRGEDFGSVAAICASSDKGSQWEWKGVYAWQESENYHGWEIDEMLIV
ncbi:hypothetical protein A1O7_07497 [Cladophialophora yegresii CBS 114405]|uniref:Heterokaryon incompatibility domain-containing protein n=1 Tax=Cladophialophora yegresii CBS 114405 TaxID=1182544 RepID=W9VN61_9EURO|nr:uncharacterized protein A1O7_07497 [Cladophialophora yegresii CBS 114405]EXJ57152.1 hypothetical protein A1O7_07497 [Cladophialophora yegresii CBS 114405]